MKSFEHNELKVTEIGGVYDGYSSTDGYVLLQTLDGEPISDDQIEQAFNELYYHECRGAGSSFCKSYRTMRDGILDDRAVMVVCHGMDI